MSEKVKAHLITVGGCALSLVVFIIVYGVKVLNPEYVEWRFLEADMMHDYLGWCGFRYADWNFPLGLFDTLSYPDLVSIIFPDSIPIFAVIFKALLPIL